MIKKSTIVIINCLTILTAPIWGGLIIWFIVFKHGVDEEFLNGKEWLLKHLITDL